MHRWNVIVAALEGHEAEAQRMRDRLLRTWNFRTAIAVEPAPITQLADAELNEFDVVVLIGDRSAPQSTTLPWLNLLEEAGVPVLALLDGAAESDNIFEFAGALVGDRTAD